MRMSQILRVVAISVLNVFELCLLLVLAQTKFGASLIYYIVFLPGLAVTFPVERMTGWSCSRWLGGHGPSCEFAIFGIVLTLATVWGSVYLVRSRVD